MKTKVGKLFRASVLAAAVGLPSGAFAQDLDALTTKELVPLAMKEGSVTIFSLSSRIARIEKAFEAAYPGIDLIGLDMSSVKQIARVEAEQQAGVHAVDVLYIADTPVVYKKLLDAGRISNYVPPRVAGELDNRYKAPHPAAARLLIDFMFGDDSPTGGPGFEPFNVPGDYATRKTITDDPDSVPLEKLNAWNIDPAKVAATRGRISDLIITLQ